MQITIASLSEANSNERLDSQFFRPEYVDSYNTVLSRRNSVLSEIAHITDGNHLKIAEEFDKENGIRYLRGQDLSTDMMLLDRNIVNIPESCFDLLKRSHIYKNDILITIVGANTGLVGLVYDPPKKLVANCKLGIARANDKEILPAYLYSFLVGRYGQHQLLRSIRGGGQTGLILPDMRQLKITRLGDSFEKTISDVVLNGHSKINASKEVYDSAQTLLLIELGLNSWQPKHQLTFIKYHSDIEQAGRIDAEYYQPKYEKIIKAIKSYSRGWDTLENNVTLGDKNFSPKSNQQYHYVELSNIAGNGEITGCMVEDGQYLPSRARRKIAKNDVIVSSIEGSLESIALVGEEYDNALCSTGFYVIQSDVFNSEFLLVFLKSIAGQMQLKKGCNGTILTAINKDEFNRIIFPSVDISIQNKIQQKITKSFELRKQSKHLLEYAKKAVEMAIEQDEQAAIKWLKNETRETQI